MITTTCLLRFVVLRVSCCHLNKLYLPSALELARVKCSNLVYRRRQLDCLFVFDQLLHSRPWPFMFNVPSDGCQRLVPAIAVPHWQALRGCTLQIIRAHACGTALLPGYAVGGWHNLCHDMPQKHIDVAKHARRPGSHSVLLCCLSVDNNEANRPFAHRHHLVGRRNKHCGA